MKDELARIIAIRSTQQDPMIITALDARIKQLEATMREEVKLVNEGEQLAQLVKDQIKDCDWQGLMSAFEATDSLVAYRIACAAAYNLMNGIFFSSMIYRDQAARMGGAALNTAGRRDWGIDDSETGTSPYKDQESPGEKMLRLQEEVEQAIEELPRWIRAAIELRKHCAAEGKQMKEFDGIPDPVEIYNKVNARSASRQAEWEAQRKAVKAQTPGLLSFLNMGS